MLRLNAGSESVFKLMTCFGAAVVLLCRLIVEKMLYFDYVTSDNCFSKNFELRNFELQNFDIVCATCVCLLTPPTVCRYTIWVRGLLAFCGWSSLPRITSGLLCSLCLL